MYSRDGGRRHKSVKNDFLKFHIIGIYEINIKFSMCKWHSHSLNAKMVIVCNFRDQIINPTWISIFISIWSKFFINASTYRHSPNTWLRSEERQFLLMSIGTTRPFPLSRIIGYGKGRGWSEWIYVGCY